MKQASILDTYNDKGIVGRQKVCIAAGICVMTLPSVFQIKDGEFVIIPDGTP